MPDAALFFFEARLMQNLMSMDFLSVQLLVAPEPVIIALTNYILGL